MAVIEDSAQSAGSKLFGRDSGTWGTVGCFSAHPLKNLNACGDAGFILTDNESIAEKIRSMRNHGHMRKFKSYPEVQIKYRLFDETETIPAIVMGLCSNANL